MFAIASIGILLLWLLYKKLTEKFKIFEERGLKFEKPVVLVGNVLTVVKGKEDFFTVLQNLYNKFYSEK